ncbi:tocopherol cyclase family protein [Smaragdicoccus niigatensis]|uniref:tocopherol cyclase family protein n=1 Tax=Smaragdicoccus niigatensis TaxID=359359 RepID=UPI00037A1E27|nr:tocopherol cyclase family protein [Smaragdicoccus niigatensis]
MTFRLHDIYRASGADLPFGDPRRAHGVAMEGYFWRFTLPDSDRCIIALIGVNRSAEATWSTLGLGSYPNGFLRTTAHPEGFADPDKLGATAGTAFQASIDRVQVDLGPDAKLDVRIVDREEWPHRPFGGSSIFQSVPALNQYWHPWLLGGRAEGTAIVGGAEWNLDGARVYGEKNWGKGGFPDSWWWGQAHGFAEPEACVAFAGGEVTAGPLKTEVTAVVVRLPDGRVLRLGNPGVSPVQASVSDERWSLRGRRGRTTVTLEGTAPLGSAHVLPVPLPAERRNIAGAIEHLGGRVAVEVRERGHVTWRGESRLAGLEHGGIERARAEVRRRGGTDEDSEAAPIAAN